MKWWQIGKRDADLERELQSDLQLEEEEQREHGIAPEEARYAALRAFGNPSVISEQTRAVWSWDRLETLLRYLRITIRTLAWQLGFSALGMLVIAVRMGATISLFTVVWSVLLKPLPFDHPEQLVRLYESSERFPANVVAAGIYGEWKRESRSFSNLALYKDWPQYNLSEGGALPEQVRATICSWDFFATLGVQPSIGRSFTAEDDHLPPTVPSSSIGLFGNAASAVTLPSSAANQSGCQTLHRYRRDVGSLFPSRRCRSFFLCTTRERPRRWPRSITTGSW